MGVAKIHASKGKYVTKTFRIIPYEEFAKVLKADGEAFLEDREGDPLKRQTVWKASKILSEMVGKTIRYSSAVMECDQGVLIGYKFYAED